MLLPPATACCRCGCRCYLDFVMVVWSGPLATATFTREPTFHNTGKESTAQSQSDENEARKLSLNPIDPKTLTELERRVSV